MTHIVQLPGCLLSFSCLTLVSVDFFLLKKGLFWDNQSKSGFLSQLSKIFNEMTVGKAQSRNWAIVILKGQSQ